MRGEQSPWGSLPGIGDMTFPGGPINLDYRVTTMKLRERALTAKPKLRSRCFLRSAPSFQNRNLDNYPMPHNRSDALRSAKGQREGKKEFLKKMSERKGDSVLMREYTKHMFDDAVKKANDNAKRDFWGKKEEYIHNGPTHDGSVLYNKRQQMLNSIRIRPHSETQTKYNHERSKSRPDLLESMNQLCTNYTVRHASTAGSRLESRPGSQYTAESTCSGSDFVFVPVHDDTDRGRRSTLDTTLSDLNESIDEDRDVFDEVEDAPEVVEQRPGYVTPVSRLLPPTIPCSIRLVSLDEDTSSESSVDIADAPEHNEGHTKKGAAPVKKGKPKVSAKLHREATAVVEEPVRPEKVKLKGPHCWVDDATVSSDQSECHLDDVTEVKVEDKKPAIPLPTEQPQLIVTPADANPTEQEINVLNINILPNGTKVDETPEVVEAILPPFLCPSSEKKSKEAAIKDWLANTSFSHASKSIPML